MAKCVVTLDRGTINEPGRGLVTTWNDLSMYNELEGEYTNFFLLDHDLREISQIPIHELLATWRKVCMMNGSFDEKEDILSEEPTLNLLSMRKIREILDIVRKVSTHPDLYIKDNVKMPLYLCDMTLFQLPNLIEDETDDTKIVPMRRSVPYVVLESIFLEFCSHYSTSYPIVSSLRIIITR